MKLREELAARLNGREYTKEITHEEEAAAKAAGLVVIFGASDDLVELRGAIYEEVGAYDGTELYISKGELLIDPDRDEREVLAKFGFLDRIMARRKAALCIRASWCDQGYSWFIRVSGLAPHSHFDIIEGEDKFCRGIVIDLKEVGHAA
jgi:hypothetical protein